LDVSDSDEQTEAIRLVFFTNHKNLVQRYVANSPKKNAGKTIAAVGTGLGRTKIHKVEHK
jgi:hypothetical protein